MSDLVLAAIIASTPPTIVALGGVVLGLLNRFQLKEVHTAVNSKMDKMLALTASASHAEGVAEGAATHEGSPP